MNDLFKYVGKTTKGEYQKDKVYLLIIEGYREPTVYEPYRRVYKSWEAFLKDWERVK